MRSPEGSQKGQDSFLMEKAAEIIESTFRVLERPSSSYKPGHELLNQIQRELTAPTEISPPHDFVTPKIPGYQELREMGDGNADGGDEDGVGCAEPVNCNL